MSQKKNTLGETIGGLVLLILLVWFFYPSTDEIKTDREIESLENNLSSIMFANKELKIYKKDYPESWTFTPDSVSIGCDRYPYIYVVDYDVGVKYALNGKSQSKYKKIEPNNDFVRSKMNLQPFINEALKLCEYDKRLKEFNKIQERLNELKKD